MSETIDAWDLWPLTVAKDRYGGAYSGGAWLAFGLTPDCAPSEPWGDDVTCAAFWGGALARDPKFRDAPECGLNYELGGIWHPEAIGRGRTPGLAVADLAMRQKERG